MKDINDKFQQKFPLFKEHLKRIYPATRDLYMYNAAHTMEEAYEIALNNDSAIDHYDVPLCMALPKWLGYHVITDYLTDLERKTFEKEHLTKEENKELSDYLDKNKLRKNPLDNIDRLLVDNDIGYPSLIVTPAHRSNWKSVRRIIIRKGESKLSAYEEYDLEARIHYIESVTRLLKEICMAYIKKHAPFL